MSALLIRGAEVAGETGVDVHVSAGRVAVVGRDLPPRLGDEVRDADGGALLPGLHDSHLHLHALAARAASLTCGPPAVRTRAALAAALSAAVADAHGWVRGVGYAESVAGDLDAAALDALHPARPVRVQHRSGALWIVNSAAAGRLGLASADHPGVERADDGTPTGRLWRADDWLRRRLPPAPLPDLTAVGRLLGALGITSVTDATPDLDDRALAGLADAVDQGALHQRLQLLGVPLGKVVPPGVSVGPAKIVLADSGLPALDDLIDRILRAHSSGRSVAVHCVTREALVLLLAAFGVTGVRPGDRVEHAALVPQELVADVARAGLRVVTQPGFLADRGDDYLRDVPADDRPDLYRYAGLLRAAVPVALSSDAPYGPLDPWHVMTAAVDRRTASGVVLGADEAVRPEQALAAYLATPEDPGGPSRRIVPGAPADLVLLDRPLADQLAAPTAGAVRATFVDGRTVYSA